MMVPFAVLIGATCLILGVQVGASAPMGKTVSNCIQSSGVTAEEIGQPPATGMSREKMCFYKCVAEGLGMLTEDGKINTENVGSILFPHGFPKDQKEKLLECASKVEKIETCEDMARIMTCEP